MTVQVVDPRYRGRCSYGSLFPSRQKRVSATPERKVNHRWGRQVRAGASGSFVFSHHRPVPERDPKDTGLPNTVIPIDVAKEVTGGFSSLNAALGIVYTNHEVRL